MTNIVGISNILNKQEQTDKEITLGAMHRTGIAEVTGSNPVEALIFFQASSFQLLKLENLLRRHSSL